MSADRSADSGHPDPPERLPEADRRSEGAPRPGDSTAAWSLREERPLETDSRDKVEVEPTARTIVEHADRRAVDGRGDHYVRGVRPDDLVHYVDGVLDRKVPNVEVKYPGNGRVAYWDPDKDAVVIEDGDGGSVFTPKQGRDYFDDL